MTIKEYENKANELLEEIEKEKELTLSVLNKMLNDSSIDGFLLTRNLAKNETLGTLWFVYEYNNDYKCTIETLKKVAISFYDLCSKTRISFDFDNFNDNFKVSNEYFRKLYETLFPTRIWISYDEVKKEFNENKSDASSEFYNPLWKLENLECSFEEKEGWNPVFVQNYVCFAAEKHDYYNANFPKIVKEIVLEKIDSEEFQLEYYENYCKALEEVIREYKRVRIYLYSVSNPEIIDEMLMEYGKDNKRGPVLKKNKWESLIQMGKQGGSGYDN